jgi:gliding motility-associated-like protein
MNNLLQKTAVLFMATLVSGIAMAVTITSTQTNVSCNGGANGTINLTVTGGIAPYTYLWNGGNTNEDRTGLIAGIHSVTVTDNVGTTATTFITLTQPTVISVYKSVTNATCGGSTNGEIDITVSGGTPGYTYLWSNSATTQDITNIKAALYYVTITDLNGCIKVDTANVTQPVGVTITSVITNVTCGSGANGAINITPSNGIPVYTFLWNDGATTEDRAGIAAGTYSVTVNDAISCVGSATFVVGQGGAGMAVNTNSTQPSCNGGTNGAVNVTTVIGSVGPYNFKWSNGVTTQTNPNVGAGTYTVTATSTTGCTASASVNLGQPTVLNTTLNIVAISCFGMSNGAINTVTTGGTTPYSYNWGGGIFTQNRTGLATGTYTVTVTDFRGCTGTQSVTLGQPLQLTLNTVPSPLACTGGPTGSVMTNVTGGTGAITYWWGAGVTSPNKINVSAGTHSVTITDANGCTAAASAVIAPYTPMTTSATTTNPLCVGSSTGSVNLTVNNGWTPYVFAWSNGSTSEDLTNVTSGTYNVTVTDAHNCTVTRSVVVSGPTLSLSVNSAINDASCFGQNNGFISLTGMNGTAPYTFNWGGGITGASRTNLAANTYNVTATDNNGCSTSSALVVNQPAAMTWSNSVTNVSCFGQSNGQILLTIVGGVSPYNYNWSNGANTQTITGLIAGSYIITATDNTGCSASTAINVSQPTAPTFSTSFANINCNAANTGTINVGASGGNGPFSYLWNDGAITANRTSLIAGNYSLTITDNNACTYQKNFTISQPTAINITSTVTNVACNGGNNSTITLVPVGGTSPYTFNWGDGVTTQNRTNLTAGNYNVTITDLNSCTFGTSATVTQPAAIALNITKTDLVCFNSNNGAVSVNVTGGTNPYTYNWSNGAATTSLISLAANTYSITATDANLCTASAVTIVTQPTQLSTSIASTNVSCFGLNNGSTNLTVNGGVGGYAFNWNNSSNNQNLSNIGAGSYTVTITDANSCSATSTTSITQPSQINITATITNITCGGVKNGSITAIVTGGNSGYTYNWSNSATTANISNLAPGTYTLTSTDANGCSANQSFNIAPVAPLTATATSTNVTCGGLSNGTITLTVNGGMIGFTYNWSNGSNNQDVSGLTAGTYTVTVFDGNNCSATLATTINEPSAIVLTAATTDVACHNGNTGAINLTTNGGVGPFNFNWSNAATSQNISNLVANTYTVTATDANNCSSSLSTAINQSSPIQIALNAVNASCFGSINGAITTAVNGGNDSYSFSWNNGATSANINSLAAGTYTLSVMDATNCIATITTTIQQPTAVQLNETHTNVSCFGGNNAAINLTANGGTGAFNFVWSNGETTEDIQQLTIGNYIVSITDANGCSSSNTINITQPTALAVTETHKDFACASNPGKIQVTTTGGTTPYQYTWTNGATSATINNLNSGTYTATITDANGCIATQSVNITALHALAASSTTVPVTCFGGNNGSINVTTNGGTTPYNFNWSNGAKTEDISNLTANGYTLTITDANNCSLATTTTIPQPSAVQIFSTINSASCNGAVDGSITLNILGGTAPYNYTWSNGGNTNINSNLSASIYSVTVQDANNCSDNITNLIVTEPAVLTVSANVLPVGCANVNDGSILAVANGGTAPYNYNWSNDATSANNAQLSTGSFDLTVTDSKGCTVSNKWSIGTTPQIAVSGAVKNTSCPSVENGAIDITITGGTPNFSINWNNGETVQNISQLAQGAYQVVVTDSRSCTAQATFNISYDYILTVDAGNYTNINLGETATLTATANGNNNNVYNWSPSVNVECAACATTTTRSGNNTTFTINVTDDYGCTAFDTVSVSVNSITDLFIPNAFTPNNDGNNDVLEIYGDINAIHYIEFNIFNRWGEKIFSTNDPTFKWDGSYKGQMVDQGAYIYTMNLVFINEVSRSDYKGSITIIR